MGDFGLLVGRYLSSLPSLTDQQLRELLLDSSGRLIISGRYIEDEAHSSGDAGLAFLGVRNDNDAALTSADGDYSPVAVDEFGRLKVVADLAVDFDFVYEEDSAFSSGSLGAYVLTVRQDTLASDTSADGDFASFKVNAKGELYVKDSDLAVLVKEEDAAHSSGDKGVMSLAVRHDADTSLVSTDGDYAPLQVNATGALKIAGQVDIDAIGSEAFTTTDDLAAAADGLVTITAAATPWIDACSLTLSSGTAYIYGWSWFCDQNAQARIITYDTTDTIVYKQSLNSSAVPGYEAHWDEGGRIEIAGATNLVVKIQIKKRSATGGNAQGSASLHARTV